MRRLSSLAWRSLLARPLRSFLTTIGIALGVAVLFASLTAAAAMDEAVKRAAAAEFGDTAIRISAVLERGLGPQTLNTIQTTPGVSLVAPALIEKTYLATNDVTGAVGNGTLPPPVTVFGIDPEREDDLHDLPLAQGTALDARLEKSALITETLARDDRIRLGDDISINGATSAGPQSYRVVGILTGDGPLAAANGRLVLLPIAAAQALFGSDGVTRVDVSGKEGTTPDELMGQLEARLTTEPYMLERQSDVAQSLRLATGDFRTILLLVSALVLFVGAFLIFNTLSMTVAETSREVGLLRAAGTTRAQVIDLILLQAVALGIAGSIVGVAVGAGLAYVITGWLRGAGTLVLPVPSLSPGLVAVSLSIGVLVTIAAALEPAWRASRISPVEALRARRDGRTATFARLRWLVVVFATLAAAAVVVWPAAAGDTAPPAGGQGPSPVSTSQIASGSGGALLVFGLLLGCVLLFPIVARPVIALAGIPLRIFRSQERLARSSLARDPSRTALTAGALIVGVAMVVALATAADNVRRTGASWLEETVPGSEILTSIRPVPRNSAVETDLAAAPGVKAVSPIALFGVPLDGIREDAAAVSGASLLTDGRLRFVSGDRAAALAALDAGGAVILPKALASRLSARVGDNIEFATGPSPLKLKVAGIVAHSIPGASGESILVSWSDAERSFGVAGADLYAVRYAGDVSRSAAVDGLARQYALEPEDLGRVGGNLGDALERIFRLLDALAIAAVLVAGLGVVNTLSMSVLERVREIGILRAAGMTRRQVWGMVVVEAALLGIAGAFVGSIAGLAVGALLTIPSAEGFGLALQLPWEAIGFAFVFGICVSVLAAVYPARAASRFSIVRALQYE